MSKLLVELGVKSSRTEAEKQVKAGVRIDGVTSTNIHIDLERRPARLAVEVGKRKVSDVFE